MEADYEGSGEPWNTPTSTILQPLSNFTFGFRILLAPSIRGKNDVLAAAAKAVVHGIPGFVVGTDMEGAALLVAPPPLPTAPARASPALETQHAHPLQTQNGIDGPDAASAARSHLKLPQRRQRSVRQGLMVRSVLHGLQSATAEPADVLTIGQPAPSRTGKFIRLPVKGLRRGRARVTLQFSDGTFQVGIGCARQLIIACNSDSCVSENSVFLKRLDHT